MSLLMAFSNTFQGNLADTAALAAVALIGYMFGSRTKKNEGQDSESKLNLELSKATEIAQELHHIASRIRQDVAAHQTNISQFKARLTNLQSNSDDDGWQKLSSEAETLLVPTMKLATDLSLAYDELRNQSLQLMNFAGSRTDPETGIFNRRAMDDQLEVLFSLHERNNSRFSLALFSVNWPNEAESDISISDFAKLVVNCARDTDIVARYSAEEFAVLMPHTSLAGGTIFSERLLRRTSNELGVTLSGGIVEVQKDENAEKLISRADSALYSARTEGYSCLFQHTGHAIRAHEIELENAPNNL